MGGGVRLERQISTWRERKTKCWSGPTESRGRGGTLSGGWVRWWGGRWMKDERRSERREAGLFSEGGGGHTCDSHNLQTRLFRKMCV